MKQKKKKKVKITNALIFRPLSKSPSDSVKLKVKHMQICIEIDYTTITTLHKFVDKYGHNQFKTVVIP